MSTCKNCLNLFKPHRSNKKHPQQFCSQICGVTFRKKRFLKPCNACGTETLNSQFCSSSCSASYNNTKTPKRVAIQRVCVKCTSMHTRPQSKYCSFQCSRPQSMLSVEEKYRLKRARYNASWAKYMATKKNQTPSDVDLVAIRKFYESCPVGYEVDHIIPVSKGGLHTLTNLQYLTQTDNRQKSNKLNWHPV